MKTTHYKVVLKGMCTHIIISVETMWVCNHYEAVWGHFSCSTDWYAGLGCIGTLSD